MGCFQLQGMWVQLFKPKWDLGFQDTSARLLSAIGTKRMAESTGQL